jgi:hypothetical protein
MPVSNRDQRGIPRTLGRNCDIGAVEMSDPIVCTSPGAITATSASWFSDPVATVTALPDEVVLRKELGAFSRYGAADGRADLLNTGQQATWHFTLPASIDPASVRGAYFQLALVADDHNAVDLSKYALSLWTNGDIRVAGCPAALPHGSPSFLPFTNWVRQGYLTSVGSASYTITLANRSTTGKTDWEGVDWIELHLLLR